MFVGSNLKFDKVKVKICFECSTVDLTSSFERRVVLPLQYYDVKAVVTTSWPLLTNSNSILFVQCNKH